MKGRAIRNAGRHSTGSAAIAPMPHRHHGPNDEKNISYFPESRSMFPKVSRGFNDSAGCLGALAGCSVAAQIFDSDGEILRPWRTDRDRLAGRRVRQAQLGGMESRSSDQRPLFSARLEPVTALEGGEEQRFAAVQLVAHDG